MKTLKLAALAAAVTVLVTGASFAQNPGRGAACMKSYEDCVAKVIKLGWNGAQAGSWCGKQPVCKR